MKRPVFWFLGSRKIKVVPKNQWKKRVGDAAQGDAGFPTGAEPGPGLKDSTPAESGSRRIGLSIWKTVLFIVIVAAVVMYAKAHWPKKIDVFRADTGTDLATGSHDDFFVEFRLDREKTEQEQIDLIKEVMSDQTASKEARDAAYAQYLSLVDAMGKELKIEGILKAKGWDSLVFLSQDACTVVVKTQALEERDAAQIGDAVKRVSKIRLENVTIIPVQD